MKRKMYLKERKLPTKIFLVGKMSVNKSFEAERKEGLAALIFSIKLDFTSSAKISERQDGIVGLR